MQKASIFDSKQIQNGLQDLYSLAAPRLYPTFKGQATSENPGPVLTRRNHQPSGVIDAAISQIASDKTSGASEILRRARTVFSLLNSESPEPEAVSVERARQTVIATCKAIVLAQPDMSSLLRLAGAVLSSALIATSAAESLESAENAAQAFVEMAERGARDSALHAATLIRDGATMLTHSRSSTVLAAFVEARRCGRNFSVFATESRPMLEGRTLAEALSRHGINVTLIADAAASLAMDRVDLILVGADKITPANLVNKIGTRMIALAARERGLPVYALCDTSKFIREDFAGSGLRPEPASELWPEAPRGVMVVNRYFEPTPLIGFTSVITEDGVLSIEEAARRAEEASINGALIGALGSWSV